MPNIHSLNRITTYTCEAESHDWTLISSTEHPLSEADLQCIEGHRALHYHGGFCAQIASVRILSAAWFESVRPDHEHCVKDFYVVLECLADGWQCISDRTYRKEEALKIAETFCGLRIETARKLWQRRYPLCKGLRSVQPDVEDQGQTATG